MARVFNCVVDTQARHLTKQSSCFFYRPDHVFDVVSAHALAERQRDCPTADLLGYRKTTLHLSQPLLKVGVQMRGDEVHTSADLSGVQ